MKNRNSHTVGAFLKLNIKIVERGKIDTHNTQIHHRSLFWLYIDTSIKCGGGKRQHVQLATVLLYPTCIPSVFNSHLLSVMNKKKTLDCRHVNIKSVRYMCKWAVVVVVVFIIIVVGFTTTCTISAYDH